MIDGPEAADAVANEIKQTPARRGSRTSISTGAKVKTVLENGDQCILQFEDGSSVEVKLADPGASVAVRDQSNAVEYVG